MLFLLFKRDLKRAYRQIPIDPGCTSWAHICQRIICSITFICGICNISIINNLDDVAGEGLVFATFLL